MTIYRGVWVLLALAPWGAQAQMSSAASGAAPAPQAPASSGQQSATPAPAQGARGSGHGAPGGQGLRPQPAIIVDANALIRQGQRANAMEEAQSAPPPRRPAPARRKPGLHLSTARSLPLSSEDAGKP